MFIFDLDGTLIDSNGLWLQIDFDFLARRGLTYTREYTDFVSHTTYQNAAVFTKEYYALSESAEKIMNAWSDMAYDAYAHRIPLKAGVLDYLEKCNASGIPLAIVTSCMSHLCHAAVKRTGLDDYFSAITTTAEVSRDKRHPDIYLLTAKKLGVSPGCCTVFEDSPSAARGAKAAGMKVIGVYDDFFAPFEEEMRKNCDGYIRSFTELL